MIKLSFLFILLIEFLQRTQTITTNTSTVLAYKNIKEEQFQNDETAISLKEQKQEIIINH